MAFGDNREPIPPAAQQLFRNHQVCFGDEEKGQACCRTGEENAAEPHSSHTTRRGRAAEGRAATFLLQTIVLQSRKHLSISCHKDTQQLPKSLAGTGYRLNPRPTHTHTHRMAMCRVGGKGPDHSHDQRFHPTGSKMGHRSHNRRLWQSVMHY